MSDGDFQILVRGSDVDSSDYNKSSYTYKFNSTAVFKNHEISLIKVQMYYSFFNVDSAKYNNNTFSYTWVEGTTRTVTLEDGFYSVNDIQLALENDMINSKYYLVNAQSQPVYYINIAINPVRYAVQVICSPVPTSLPSGWSLPSGATWSLPLTSLVPQFNVGTNNFGSLIGFVAGSYPALATETTQQSFISSFTPVITPVGNIFVSIDLIDMSYSSTPYASAIFSAGEVSQFGRILTIEPQIAVYQGITDGMRQQCSVRLYDQNFSPIKVNDNSATCFQFMVRKRKQK